MNKRNIPYIITYSLEILLVLLVAVFYRQPLLAVLLLLLIIMPPLSIIITKREMEKLTVAIASKNPETTRDGIINIIIKANYKGIIPLLNCTVSFTYENLFYPHSEIQDFTFPAETKREGIFTLPFSVTKAGMIVFNATTLNVTDYLHLYTFTKPMDIKLDIPVLPLDIPAPVYPKKKSTPTEGDGEITEIPTSSGEKTRDLKELREYRDGDRLKDIHWKLTAKTDEIMVREYEEIKELYYTILPILDVDSLQDTLEVFLAISKDLLKEREPFAVNIYNSSDKTFDMCIITEEEDFYTTLFEIFRCPLKGYNDAVESYLNNSYGILDGIIIIKNGKVISKENND